jgi:2'-hydroxyisoflavone reductase
MRLLVLGGSVFVSRAVAREALAAGHDVTCATRGVSGEPPAGTTAVRIDRDEPDGLAPLRGMEFDAVVDVSSRPSHVRAAVAELAPRVGHAVYVSSGSVYPDHATPNQRAVGAAVFDPAPPGVDDPADRESYGARKVACEQAVVAGFGADRAFVCRAGLIIGPEDTYNRFPYWVSRLADGGEVLAPGAPGDPVQFVDVRDLAAWLVDSAATGRAGTYDGIGAPVTREHLLIHTAAGVGVPVELTWVPQDFLVEHDVRPWMGERALPLWLPLPEYAGFMTRDVDASLDAGLSTRDVADSARDTLAWLKGPGGTVGSDGELSRVDEADVLAKWREQAG